MSAETLVTVAQIVSQAMALLGAQELRTGVRGGVRHVPGVSAEMLRAIPVRVVTVNAALLGAAIYGLEQAALN